MILEKFSLKGKSGIITGGGVGIGKAMTMALAQAGAEALIVGRRKDVLETAAEELKQSGHRVIPFPADVSRMEQIPKIADKALKEFAKIDFLINNAGIARRGACEEHTEENWDAVMQINLKAPFFLAQAVAKTMIAAKRPGAIINISSLMAVCGGKNLPGYAASKAAISQVTKSMANDWAKYSIRVNAIGPGWFATDLNKSLRGDKNRQDEHREITNRIPMGRWGSLDELGGVAVFLASDASSYMTGQTVFVDGGWLSF
jgi:2-dehydro-3-deoxy-D-gluconate 5-dehydrogenase